MSLSVYQIGLGSFGRYGFEKFVELHNHFDSVDVELKGVCDKDFDRLEAAEKFALAQDIEVEVFEGVEELYSEASKTDGEVLIYDAGPSNDHAGNIFRSMQHNFFHLTEKPPSMNREQHLREKELAEKSRAMWMVDFIERENPVVKKTLQLLEGKSIDSIKVFRESSVGVEKMLNPVERHGVRGGDILDKMTHEVYVLDFLEKTGEKLNLELKDAETKYFMPWKPDSQKMMSIDGVYTEKVDYKTSTGQTKAFLQNNSTDISLHTSWLGLSDECRLEAQKIRGKLDETILDTGYSEISETAFANEEARFFTIAGEINLVGDMLHNKLYNLDSGEQIELDYFIHDQLYRVIRKAVLKAAGEDVETVSDKEIDVFMNAIFDIKEEVAEGDFLDELDKSLDHFESLVVRDRKVLETEVTEFIPS